MLTIRFLESHSHWVGCDLSVEIGVEVDKITVQGRGGLVEDEVGRVLAAETVSTKSHNYEASKHQV